jgi:hypothetical protein
MKGLFDLLNSDDPAIRQGLLQAGVALLGSRGNFGQSLGQGLGAGLLGTQQFRDRQSQMERQKLQDQLLQGQVGQMRQQESLAQLPGRYIVPPSAPTVDAAGGMETAGENPNNSNAGRMDLAGLANAYMAAPGGLQSGMALQQSLQKTVQRPEFKVVNGSLVRIDGDKVSEAYRAPTNDALPSGMRMGPNGPEWIPGYLEGRSKVAQAGAARNQMLFKQEGKEAEKVGGFFGEQYANVQSAGMTAQSKLNKLSRMESLMQGYETGKLTPLGKDIASYMQSVGIKIDPNLGNKEAFEALSNEMALEARNPSGGAGMPGAMSDQDRAFLQNIVPGLSKTTGGNKVMIETHRRIAKRDQDVAKLARDYRKKNGSIDEGFYEELAAFSAANPLFKDMQGGAPSGGSYDDAEKERRYQEWKRSQK